MAAPVSVEVCVVPVHLVLQVSHTESTVIHQCRGRQFLRFKASDRQRLSAINFTRQWYRRRARLFRLITGRHEESGSRMLVGEAKRRWRTLGAVERGRWLVVARTCAEVMWWLGMIHYRRIILTDWILSNGRSDGVTRAVHKAWVAGRPHWCRQHWLICCNVFKTQYIYCK